MKITGIKIMMYTGEYHPAHSNESRQVGQLDFYDDFRLDEKRIGMRSMIERKGNLISQPFIVVTTDEGVEGIHGPVDYRAQNLVAVDGLAPFIAGRDPLENRLLWDVMSRFERHSRAGVMMMAISAVDNALWDLKGKILGQPVYKLLGGGRDRLNIYMSMLGFSVEPAKAAERALWAKGTGVKAQKWFFRYGPGDGMEGMRKNLNMAFAVREAVGDDYELMFDCWLGWDIAYAKRALLELKDVRPMWVEEILRPHMEDGYDILKQETDVPLSAGEHLYTRMEVNHYLKKGIFDVMQSDPEWCGGITETLRIADLCEVYGTRMIPHGHRLLPAMHVIAASSPQTCPYVEYLIQHLPGANFLFKQNYLPDGGCVNMPKTPGLGGDIDFDRVVESREVRSIEL